MSHRLRGDCYQKVNRTKYISVARQVEPKRPFVQRTLRVWAVSGDTCDGLEAARERERDLFIEPFSLQDEEE